MSLRRHMVHWRSELTSQYSHLTDTNADWVGTGIADYEKRNNDTVWTIRELRNADAIRREGKNMQHCVATYISDCARRGTSIWSMFIVRDGRTMRVATIEVKPVSRRIVQVSGRRNTIPTETEMAIVNAWARKEELRIGP